MTKRYFPDENGMVGAGVGFERIRRITGYLVGTIDRFNNAKQAEVRERIKHNVNPDRYDKAQAS